jgi:hypothetical protein
MAFWLIGRFNVISVAFIPLFVGIVSISESSIRALSARNVRDHGDLMRGLNRAGEKMGRR